MNPLLRILLIPFALAVVYAIYLGAGMFWRFLRDKLGTKWGLIIALLLFGISCPTSISFFFTFSDIPVNEVPMSNVAGEVMFAAVAIFTGIIIWTAIIGGRKALDEPKTHKRSDGLSLELEDGTSYHNPTEANIIQALMSLNPNTNTFAILNSGESEYIQVAVSNNGYVLEYQTGDLSQHYVSSKPMALEEVIKAFQLYASNDPTWKTITQWEQMHL